MTKATKTTKISRTPTTVRMPDDLREWLARRAEERYQSFTDSLVQVIVDAREREERKVANAG